MKETQKIYDVLKILDEMDQNGQTERAKQHLRAFLIANDTVKKSDKVNIWKFTCDKDMPGKRAITYRDDNYTALFMPVTPPEEKTDDILYLV